MPSDPEKANVSPEDADKAHMEDRRQFKREKISPHLKILFPDTGNTVGAFITNLSKGGVEVYTDHAIPAEGSVVLSISFSSEAGRGEEEVVDAEIRWMKKAGTRYLVGMAFSRVDRDKHPILCDILEFVEK
jgi:hypothetical protein